MVRKLQHIGDFLSWIQRSTIDKWDIIKQKCFCTAKEIVT